MAKPSPRCRQPPRPMVMITKISRFFASNAREDGTTTRRLLEYILKYEVRTNVFPPSRSAVSNPSPISLSVPRKHLAHCCLAGMVISGNAEKYEELRIAYNSVLDDGLLRAPPVEEYRGMSSICGNIMCKWVLSRFVSSAVVGCYLVGQSGMCGQGAVCCALRTAHFGVFRNRRPVLVVSCL